jgi:hypothetical protein
MQARFYDERPSNGTCRAGTGSVSVCANIAPSAKRGSLRADLQPGLLPDGSPHAARNVR